MTVMLAIEMSQRSGGVALDAGAGRVHVESFASAPHHDDVLMPAIDRACRTVGVEPAGLDAVAVSVGPGGFTGLRIAISAVKMLALALDVKVVAVPTALVVAERCTVDDDDARPWLVALAAKRTSFWATRVRRGDAPCAIVGAPGLVEAEDVDLDGLRGIIADRFLPPRARQRADGAGLPVTEPMFDPAACLAVGRRLLAAGAEADPHTLLPMYPRAPEAVRLWERR